MNKLRNRIIAILLSLLGAGGVLGAIRLSQPMMTLFSGAVSPTTTVYMAVGGERNITCDLTLEAVTGTLKFAGSIQDSTPDIDSAQAEANKWDYVQVVDTEDGTSIDGDTGLSFTGTSDVRQFEVNTNFLKWFGADWTTATSGTSTLDCRPSNNQ